MLAEYLYIDETRLDSYFQQISLPVAFDKKPTWKVGFSLTGPVVEGTQSSFPRPPTQHEKICTVLDYLNKKSYLKRPEETTYGDFVFESLDAAPVHIPVPKNAGLNRDYVSLWVGTPKTVGGGFRFLLEDFLGDDNELPAVLSGYSCLQAMLDEFGNSVRDFLARNIKHAEQGNKPKKLANVSWDYFDRAPILSLELRGLLSLELERAGIPHSILPVVINSSKADQWKTFQIAIGKERYSLCMTRRELTIERNEIAELSALLTSEPLALFANWGAKIGDQRPVDALYRIRQGGRDYAHLPHLFNVTVIGYPIFLTSHPSPFNQE